MASYIERGDSLFIPFRNGQSISDSQCRPRMYKSKENFEKSFPAHNLGNKNIELVEYKEVKHAKWVKGFCSDCGQLNPTSRLNEWTVEFEDKYLPYCPKCGSKMDSQL